LAPSDRREDHKLGRALIERILGDDEHRVDARLLVLESEGKSVV
jgi:hypothetical protein